MNKKSGFTLIELLATFVIMGLLIVVAVPNVLSVSNTINNNIYCSKIEEIESAALLYANDYYSSHLDSSKSDYILVNGTGTTVSTLVDIGYIAKENKECTIDAGNCVTDPLDSTNYLDGRKVYIYTKNKRFYVVYGYSSDEKNNKICGNDTTYEIITSATEDTKETEETSVAGKYNIYFDSTGGSEISPLTNLSSTGIQSKINNAGKPTKSGATFKYWSKQPEGQQFSDDTISSNLVLYAVWG